MSRDELGGGGEIKEVDICSCCSDSESGGGGDARVPAALMRYM